MEYVKKYEYMLEQQEIMEFCLHAWTESAKCRKWVWFRLMLILVLECILLPRVAVWIVVLIAVVLLISTVASCVSIGKSITGCKWTIWVENGILKVDRGGSSEVPCRDIQLIRTTRRLLMLGYLQTAQRPAWFIVPLRVFADRQEQEWFLDRIRDPRPAEDSGIHAGSEEEGLRFAYTLDEVKWVRVQKGALGIMTSGTIGMRERLRLVLIWSFFAVLVMLSCIYLAAGHLSWQSVLFGVCVAALITARIFLRDPERALRRQIRTPAVRDRECGAWQITLSESGVCTRLPGGLQNDYPWETLAHLVETEEAFYIFHRDRKHYTLIAKESFQDWSQVSALHELCAQKGVKYVQGRKMHYLSDWAFLLIVVLFAALSMACLFLGIFWDHVQEMHDQVQGVSQGIYRPETFDPADYPDYVPLDEQVEVLESFGLHVPKETVESVRGFMTEYDMQASIEGFPYTWLLTELGAPRYREDDWTTVEAYSKDVFWFDFEGLDISTDYVDILNGMLALAQGSCLDTVTDISEDTSKVNWEEGKGKVEVCLEWDGQPYHWVMDMQYDWIDGDVLGMLNALLVQGGSGKFFYAAGDNGQGAIVFFCTAEWAEDFGEATGLDLSNYRVWSVEQKQRVNMQEAAKRPR